LEVGDLAVGLGTGRPRGRGVELDLRATIAAFRPSPAGVATVYVGHLAHLLPVRDVVVLRCHPVELGRRLRLARRGSARERSENAVAEATDLILLESIDRRRRVWEVDTTRRTVADVAREVIALLRRRPPPRYGTTSWLEDPRVTEHLLRPVP
jgi:adenylate kinase